MLKGGVGIACRPHPFFVYASFPELPGCGETLLAFPTTMVERRFDSILSIEAGLG